MSGNVITVGKSWPSIEKAHAKALAEAPAPRCQYHLGITMVRVPHGFRCPAVGCHAVSGIATVEDEGEIT
jgi:hypothetical protein